MLKRLPNLYHEKKLWKKNFLVVGIDEVGRGALAGPLYVGAVCLHPVSKNFDSPSFFIKLIESLGIDDSKRLTAKKREKLAKIIKKIAPNFSVVGVSTAVINKKGITEATRKAVRQAVKKLIIPSGTKAFLLLDAFYIKYIRGIGLKNQKAIIRGDSISLSIAAASIVAKVERDKHMRQLAKKYPKYHWNKNKGYGTNEHIAAIKKYGKTKLHRDLYLRKILSTPLQ